MAWFEETTVALESSWSTVTVCAAFLFGELKFGVDFALACLQDVYF